MSDKKTNRENSPTFQKIIEEADQMGTLSHAAAHLIKNFSAEQKELTIDRARGLSKFVDRLKYLIENLEEEPEDG